MNDPCRYCGRGREACQWCHDVAEEDFEAICDCGLYDFSGHLIECEQRAGFKWVIAQDEASAQERL